MTISARSILMAGVATLTVTAIAAAPSIQPAAPPRSEPAGAVQLSAKTQPLIDRAELTAWLAAAQRRSRPSSVSTALVDQQAAPTAALFSFPGLGNAIINAYNFIEPIVAYGVQWAQYLVGWIPFGYLIGDQIGIFYFNLIEPIAETITYNIAYWIGGSKSFLQALNDGILDSANAGIGFLNAEIRWGWGFLPPLPFGPPQIPYLPWFGLLQTQTAGVATAGLTPEVGATNAASDLVDAIYVPVRNGIDYGIDVLRAVLAPIPLANIAGDQVSILNSLINTGINEINYFAGFPLIPTAAAQTRELDRTTEVSTVPSIVKSQPIESNGLRAGLIERRTDDATNVGAAAEEAGNGVVRAPGAIRGAVTKAVSDATNTLRPGKPDKSVAGVANASTSVVKSLADTARKVVKQAREAAKDAGDAVKNRPAPAADE
ncbi:hypothetical protein [Mycolicibacterium stellerae]|uniref:hypothetical protein n=1 Tax=Mycolicibacterium stellerae TaxID=2358193 RepID=UPI000F0B4100|nr:hypothetical protein [Mycolicibacterium stellerae]